MGESFFGFNVAVRGLFSAQRNLDTVNHNLNNINTPGYSRQQSVQVASRPMALADGTGMMGTGAEVTSVRRIRDEYLDFKYWSENISFGEWTAKKEALSDIEVTFNEPSNSGFTTIMSDFYDSMQELAKDPSSAAVRSLVKQRGVTLAKYFNSMASHFEELQKDLNYKIQTKVEAVNSYATQIKQLNRQIYITELDGNVANDMRDQRTLLVDKLSKIVNIDASEVVAGRLPDGREDKHFLVTISGKALVDHFTISELALVQRDQTQKVNNEDVGNLYEVKWADGNKLNIKGGELRGYLDVRDGNEGSSGGPNGIASPNYKGIPFYQKKLNEFVQTFARAFNEGYIDTDATKGYSATDTFGTGHADGYGYGSGATDNGIRFFTMTVNKQAMSSDDFTDGIPLPTDPGYNEAVYNLYSSITAKNFAVSSDIMNDYNLIATSDVVGQAGNIEMLNELLGFRRNADMFAEGAPEDFMKSLVATLGIDTEQAGNYRSNQQVVVKQIVNRRLSDSGVSIDEEMTNLVKFQQAYSASAKMIQTMNEVYETLINKLFI